MARALSILVLLSSALVAGGCVEDREDITIPTCAQGQTFCGSCRENSTFETDPDNCGGCAISCGAGSSCSAGGCVCGGATPTLCPNENPRCVDTTADPGNCGGCGQTCTAAAPDCVGSLCACEAPKQVCNGTTCVDLQTSEAHCGGCNQPCLVQGQQCQTGTCACAAGFTACPVASPTHCANLQTSEADCGACGIACPSGATCTTGACACPAGPVAGCGATCCAGGDACCPDGGCQLAHANGVGGTYFECGAQDQHTPAQAALAAASWAPGGAPGAGFPCQADACLCWENATATQAGIWCFAGSAQKGLARITTGTCAVAACPTGTFSAPINAVRWH
jgi:hypothetical protein